MCFNIFAPLAANLELASIVFSHILPSVTTVTSIQIEYTPPNDIFKDQRGFAGVDCDLLVTGIVENGDPVIIVIETKFVEPEFSICGFRNKSLSVCPYDIKINKQDDACLYTVLKEYLYWQRTWQVNSLDISALPAVGCPFGGPLWPAMGQSYSHQNGSPQTRSIVCNICCLLS